MGKQTGPRPQSLRQGMYAQEMEEQPRCPLLLLSTLCGCTCTPGLLSVPPLHHNLVSIWTLGADIPKSIFIYFISLWKNMKMGGRPALWSPFSHWPVACGAGSCLDSGLQLDLA